MITMNTLMEPRHVQQIAKRQIYAVMIDGDRCAYAERQGQNGKTEYFLSEENSAEVHHFKQHGGILIPASGRPAISTLGPWKTASRSYKKDYGIQFVNSA